MSTGRLTYMLCACAMVAACAEEPPPPSVADFMDNSILLEATMVRCSQDRSSMKYEAECVNARDAINRIARAEEEARRAELESRSERKRKALRRAQEAAADVRRQAEEEERQRQEAEYLGQFEALPEETGEMPGGGEFEVTPIEPETE